MFDILQETDFFAILIFLFLIASSVLFSNFLKKNRKKIELELYRKIAHILIGIIFSLTPFFMSKTEIIFSSIILVLGIWIGKYSPFFKSFFSIKRISYGMWLTPLSLGIMAFLWLPEKTTPFLFGIFVLTFSDSLAALIGKWSKNKKYSFFKKTKAGSLAFFISTILILFFLSPQILILKFILISLILTFLEFILIFGLDNLFLPIISSTLFYLLLL